MNVYTFNAGALLWGTMRRELGVLQSYFPEVTYTESKGWVERVFVVRGSEEALKIWHNYMKKLEVGLNKE